MATDTGKQGRDQHCGASVAVLLKYGQDDYFRL
jgi:hypothetical protein